MTREQAIARAAVMERLAKNFPGPERKLILREYRQLWVEIAYALEAKSVSVDFLLEDSDFERHVAHLANLRASMQRTSDAVARSQSLITDCAMLIQRLNGQGEH